MQVFLLTAIAGTVMLLETSCVKTIPPEELKASIELIDVSSRWEKKYYQPWPPKLTLVPAISFRIKNVGERSLSYVYCNGIFRFSDERKNFGDNFVTGIGGKEVKPGKASDIITLQSFFGVEGKNLAHFKNNPAWKTAEVTVFVKSKGSQYVEIEKYEISKEINFKEPEPVGMQPTPQKDNQQK